MDDLTPPLLEAIRELRWNISAGRSVRDSVNAYLRTHHHEFALSFGQLWTKKIQGQPTVCPFDSHRAQALWDLVERGYQGQPIAESLALLESDVEAAAINDLEMHVAALPFRALVPLLLFQFPAFALLLIGPLLREMARVTMAFAVLTILTLSPSSPATAEPLTSAALNKLGKARGVAELDRIARAFEELQIIRMACDLQLKEQNVPATCYRALALEQKWQLSSAQNTVAVRGRLDRRCSEAASRFRGLDGFDLDQVSAACRSSVARAQELRDYQRPR